MERFKDPKRLKNQVKIEMDRYIRQTTLKELSQEKQDKLKEKKVTIIGTGALGGFTSSLLTRAGIGKIVLIDKDKVELSNLHRHFELTEKDKGESKAKATAKKLKKINNETTIDAKHIEFNLKNGEELIKDTDLIIDGTDNLSTRFLINKLSHKKNTPWIYGACIGTKGMSMAIIPWKTPCLKCIIPKQPRCLDKCEERGIINTVPPIVSSYQTTQAIKTLTGEEPSKKLLSFDLWKDEFKLIKTNRNKECPTCSRNKEEKR